MAKKIKVVADAQRHKWGWNIKQQKSSWFGYNQTDANIKASAGLLFGDTNNQRLPERQYEKPITVLSTAS